LSNYLAEGLFLAA